MHHRILRRKIRSIWQPFITAFDSINMICCDSSLLICRTCQRDKSLFPRNKMRYLYCISHSIDIRFARLHMCIYLNCFHPWAVNRSPAYRAGSMGKGAGAQSGRRIYRCRHLRPQARLQSPSAPAAPCGCPSWERRADRVCLFLCRIFDETLSVYFIAGRTSPGKRLQLVSLSWMSIASRTH